jgi:hypothetical protein
MSNNIEIIFDSMLKFDIEYDYNWSFNCSKDIEFYKKEYLDFKVNKWVLLEKNTIIFCNTCELEKLNVK